jgi:hypothetical protein
VKAVWTCTECRETKPLSEFYKDKRKNNNRTPKCKKCHQFVSYKSSLVRKYGLTFEAFQALERGQGGLCAICRRPPNEGRSVVAGGGIVTPGLTTADQFLGGSGEYKSTYSTKEKLKCYRQNVNATQVA